MRMLGKLLEKAVNYPTLGNRIQSVYLFSTSLGQVSATARGFRDVVLAFPMLVLLKRVTLVPDLGTLHRA